MTLFTPTETGKNSTLMDVIDGVNKKLGRNTITIGRTNSQGGSFSKREFSSPQYTTRWNDIADVKAR
ncbi:MAG: DUF4113 domain-containing protein [Candidatus Paceibacterota bacterium]